jgi:hypothetical protein
MLMVSIFLKLLLGLESSEGSYWGHYVSPSFPIIFVIIYKADKQMELFQALWWSQSKNWIKFSCAKVWAPQA